MSLTLVDVGAVIVIAAAIFAVLASRGHIPNVSLPDYYLKIGIGPLGALGVGIGGVGIGSIIIAASGAFGLALCFVAKPSKQAQNDSVLMHWNQSLKQDFSQLGNESATGDLGDPTRSSVLRILNILSPAPQKKIPPEQFNIAQAALRLDSAQVGLYIFAEKVIILSPRENINCDVDNWQQIQQNYFVIVLDKKMIMKDREHHPSLLNGWDQYRAAEWITRQWEMFTEACAKDGVQVKVLYHENSSHVSE